MEDTTQCKFEATSPSSDEVVLFNILQVGGVCRVCYMRRVRWFVQCRPSPLQRTPVWWLI